MLLISRLKEKLNKKKRNKKFRIQNAHNSIYLGNCSGPFDATKIRCGNYSYGIIDLFSFGKTDSQLRIGNFCSISNHTKFLIGGEHSINNLSSYPFKTLITHTGIDSFSKGDIIIDDDVWIGTGVTILSGVHIGQGAVIAAGSLVIKDVEPYSVIGGVPAHLIKYRFSLEIINELLKVDFSKLTKEKIFAMEDLLYKEINFENVSKIVTTLNDEQ